MKGGNLNHVWKSDPGSPEEKGNDFETGRRRDRIRKENRIPMKIPEIDVSYSIFTPSRLPDGREAKITGLMVRVQPGHWVTERMISHSTYDESLLLLKGEMELHMDNSVYTIHEGDSFYIPSGSLHNYMNRSKEEAVIVVYFSQLVY